MEDENTKALQRSAFRLLARLTIFQAAVIEELGTGNSESLSVAELFDLAQGKAADSLEELEEMLAACPFVIVEDGVARLDRSSALLQPLLLVMEQFD